MAIVLRNLIENAQQHGSGQVRVRLERGHVSIYNPVASVDLPEAPFAKGSKSTGMGMGLSIVSQLCAAMGVTIGKEIHECQLIVTLAFGEQ